MFRRKITHGKTYRIMGTCGLEGYHGYTPDADLEGSSNGERILGGGDWGDHGPKTGRRAREEQQKCRVQCSEMCPRFSEYVEPA